MDKNVINQFRGKYYFLSNFYISPFLVDNIEYQTAEHFFQSHKTLHKDEFNWILESRTPSIAKSRGRKVTLRDDWENMKNRIMLEGLYYKFSQNLVLKQSLLDTNNYHLIEGNYWHDNYWGDCYCVKCNNIKGKNKLGILLMNLRTNFREEQ